MTLKPKPAAARLLSPARRPSRRRGMALVITLSLVVLAAFAVMAFFVRATSNRVIESTRSQQLLVGQVARSAEAYLVTSLLQEIEGNSTVLGSGAQPKIYQPTSPASMVPAKSVSDGINGTNFPTLIRQSVPSADPNASNNSTADPSANGFAIPPGSWNAPHLHLGTGFTQTDQAPNWIYVQRDGSVSPTAGNQTIGRFAYNLYETGGLLDASVAGYPSSVTGSGLLGLKGSVAGADLTALGISASDVGALIAFRNPMADSASAYTNYVAGAVRTGFLSPVVATGSGAGSTTNNFFATRQDLIRYVTTQNNGLADALPFLSHSSRFFTAPGWGPLTPPGSSIEYAAQSNNPTSVNRFFPNVRVQSGFSRADGTQARPGEPLVKTKFPLSRLAGLSWNGVSTNGTTTLVDGLPAPASPATIQRDFGLQWDSDLSLWKYTGSSGGALQNRIKTIEEVAAENREPNFFELLKAAILRGALSGGTAINSMGAHLNPAYSRQSGDTTNSNPLEDIHIIQIGANIIDQQDADSFPTAVRFGVQPIPMDFYGVEDLPYIARCYFTYFRPPTGFAVDSSTFQPSYRPFVCGWLRFDLWNPHRQTSSSPSGQLRLVLDPKGNSLFMRATNLARVDPPRGSGTNANVVSSPMISSAQSLETGFVAGDFRESGKFPGSTYAGSTHGGGFSIPPFAGFSLGALYLPHIEPLTTGNTTNTSPNPLDTPDGVGADCSNAAINLELTSYDVDATSPPNVNFHPELRLEISTPAGWRTYQKISNFTPRVTNTLRGGWWLRLADMDRRDSYPNNTNPPNANDRAVLVGGLAWAFPDPRCQRFGFPQLESGWDSRADSSDTSTVPMNLPTARLAWGAGTPSDDLPNTSDSRLFDPSYNFGSGRQSTHVSPTALGFLGYRSFSSNKEPFGSFVPDSDASAPHNILHNTSYRDTDLVQRRGDNSPSLANDFYTDASARPVVLNRPFLSIGELGVVFRDTPWRTLDLCSTRAGDAGLADVFTLAEQPTVAAGKINMNTAPREVLESVFNGIMEDAVPSPGVLAASKASSILDAFLQERGNGFFSSTAEALSRLGASVEDGDGLVSASGTGSFTGSDVLIKTRRDALARAFSDAADFRTWVLFGDVVAQSGSLAGGGRFRVEAQERLWISFALDRMTGEFQLITNEKVAQ